MGYYSRFEITQPKNPVSYEEAKDYLEEISNYTFDNYNDILISDDAKWYDYREDMAKLSAKFPDTVFKVHREGEEAGDIEDTYYYHGMIQSVVKVEIKLPEPPWLKDVPVVPQAEKFEQFVKVAKGRKFRE